MQRADLTLSAGPNDVVPEARAALAAPVLYHYDPVFIEHFRATERLVGRIFRTTSHEIILMQGEAVLGLEAAARSLVTRGTPVLNLVSGVFGKGFGHWLRAIGADLLELEVPYDSSVTVEQVRDHLDRHPEVKVLSMVHCETPSGTLNPVREIGLLCRERGVVTVVDVVASLGGIPLESEAWGLDLLVAGPQKCLGGPPGMSLMAISPQAWAAIDANPDAPRGSYLSITDYRDLWHGKGRFPFTPSVPDVNGVAAAAEALLAEGLEAAQGRHDRVARACRAGVRAMGLRVWAVSDDICAASVTSIAVADGLTDIQVRDHCRARYGVQLSAGQNAGNLVRIGHMGNTARPMWMVAGLAAVGRTFADLGVTVSIGAGIEAAMASLAGVAAPAAPVLAAATA
jgi:pyridoxamine--pyruvate transaminase